MDQLDICKMTILCVDHNATNRELMREMLSKNYSSHQIFFAESYSEALKTVKEHQPDIFVVDLNMPSLDWDGISLEISMLDKHNETIAMSDRQTSESIQRYLKSGIKNHISKPINFDNLIYILDYTMERIFSERLSTVIVSKNNS